MTKIVFPNDGLNNSTSIYFNNLNDDLISLKGVSFSSLYDFKYKSYLDSIPNTISKINNNIEETKALIAKIDDNYNTMIDTIKNDVSLLDCNKIEDRNPIINI